MSQPFHGSLPDPSTQPPTAPFTPSPPSAPFAPGAASVPNPTQPAAYTAPIPVQYGGPPISSVPSGYGPVASGPPAFSGPPAYSGSDGSDGSKNKVPLIVTSILAAVLLIIAGTMTGLFIAKSGDLDDTRKELNAQVADRDTQLTSKTAEIEQLKKDWQTTKDKLAQTEQSLTGTQNSRDQVEKEKAVIAKCLELLTAALTKVSNGTRATPEEIKAIDTACTEADKYL